MDDQVFNTELKILFCVCEVKDWDIIRHCCLCIWDCRFIGNKLEPQRSIIWAKTEWEANYWTSWCYTKPTKILQDITEYSTIQPDTAEYSCRLLRDTKKYCGIQRAYTEYCEKRQDIPNTRLSYWTGLILMNELKCHLPEHQVWPNQEKRFTHYKHDLFIGLTL